MQCDAPQYHSATPGCDKQKGEKEAEAGVGRWEVVIDSLVKDSTIGEWKLSIPLSGVALTFNRHLMVRTILIKAGVQRKDNMRCTHDRNASGRCKESERHDVDHIEYKMLLTWSVPFL